MRSLVKHKEWLAGQEVREERASVPAEHYVLSEARKVLDDIVKDDPSIVVSSIELTINYTRLDRPLSHHATEVTQGQEPIKP